MFIFLSLFSWNKDLCKSVLMPKFWRLVGDSVKKYDFHFCKKKKNYFGILIGAKLTL